MNDKNEIIKKPSDESGNQLKVVSNFEIFLKQLGLPSDNILASDEDKQIVANNIQSLILNIPPSQRENASYLAKFISSVAIGRFDSALNDLWNEVVNQLRKSVVLYGIDIFFDTAVPNKDRDDYSKEEDLSSIKDRTLLDVCLKLEILSDIVYKKLVYILDMRNNIGGSHPNNGTINAYELLGWLQVSVQEVISVKPSEGAIKVKKFVSNLKKQTSEFSETDVQVIKLSLSRLSTVLSGNLLKTLFGMYTDPKISNEVKINIIKFAPTIWNLATNQVKYDLGAKLETFSINLETERDSFGQQFFASVGGNKYKTPTRRSLEISNISADLLTAHFSWDNYMGETPKARQLMSYIDDSSNIPIERQEDLIKTLLICRIGKEVNYLHGVSDGGRPYYNKFFKLLNSDQIRIMLKLIQDQDILINLSTTIRRENFLEILEMLPKSLTDERVQETLDYLKQGSLSFDKKIRDSRFKDLVKGF